MNRVPLMLGVGLVALLGALLLWTASAHRPGTRSDPGHRAALELKRTNLSLVDGRLREPGRSDPFTGWMVEHYPGGSLMSRSWVSNGVLAGLAEGYHPDGVLQVREHFLDGVSHGLRVKWYTNSVRESETEIVHGRIEGVFQRWHLNGQLAERLEMRDGEPNGLSRAWDEDGTLKAEVRMAAGRIVAQGPLR